MNTDLVLVRFCESEERFRIRCSFETGESGKNTSGKLLKAAQKH